MVSENIAIKYGLKDQIYLWYLLFFWDTASAILLGVSLMEMQTLWLLVELGGYLTSWDGRFNPRIVNRNDSPEEASRPWIKEEMDFIREGGCFNFEE